MDWAPPADTGHIGDLWDSLPASAQLPWPYLLSVEPNDFCGDSTLLPGLCSQISFIPAQEGLIDAWQGWAGRCESSQTPKEGYGTSGPSNQGSQGCTLLLLRGRVEDAAITGRAVALGTAKQSPCTAHEPQTISPAL